MFDWPAGAQGILQQLVVARDVGGKTALDIATAAVNRPIATLLRQTLAAMIIQTYTRNFTRSRAQFKIDAATRIQRVYRGRHARTQYVRAVRARDLRLNHAARVVQRRYRTWAVRPALLHAARRHYVHFVS
eukprot:SAG11_NODE_2186_length_3710_cov_1.860426_4_plen_131_part_00